MIILEGIDYLDLALLSFVIQKSRSYKNRGFVTIENLEKEAFIRKRFKRSEIDDRFCSLRDKAYANRESQDSAAPMYLPTVTLEDLCNTYFYRFVISRGYGSRRRLAEVAKWRPGDLEIHRRDMLKRLFPNTSYIQTRLEFEIDTARDDIVRIKRKPGPHLLLRQELLSGPLTKRALFAQEAEDGLPKKDSAILSKPLCDLLLPRIEGELKLPLVLSDGGVMEDCCSRVSRAQLRVAQRFRRTLAKLCPQLDVARLSDIEVIKRLQEVLGTPRSI